MLAERIRFAGNEEAQVKKAFEIAYQRMPAAEELAASVSFMREEVETDSPLKSFCWALLSSNEFLFID